MNQLVQATLNDLVARIEAGTSDWIRDWIGGGMPRNWTTGKRYHGVNVLLLWSAKQKGGWPTNEWASYKQWQDKGRQVGQGEGSTVILIAKDAVRRGGNPDNPDDHYRLLKCAFVFNAAQLTEPLPIEQVATPVERIVRAEGVVGGSGARISEGDQPLYRPTTDTILVPPIEKFLSAEGYYVTVFHELVHWTAHKSRLNRSLPYATEELVAELGAAFLCAGLGIDNIEDNCAAYLRSWLKDMPDKGAALMKAASDASKAHEYILNPPAKEDMVMAS